MGANDAASDRGRIYLWGDRSEKAPTAFEAPPDRPIRLRVPHGTSRIPVLVQLVSAAATRRGHIPLHASSFRWRGWGVLVAGWSRGGKSEALLSFMERGATYVGDEWMFMSPDEPVVGGIPEPIRIRDWHLDELPHLRRRIPAPDRLRMAALRGVGSVLDRTARRAGSRTLDKLTELVEGRRHVRVDPARLFGSRSCLRRSGVDVVFLMESAATPGLRVSPLDPAAGAGRIAASSAFEHLRLLEAELKQAYARPGAGTPMWEAIEPTGEALAKHLADLAVYEVVHPYPVSTSALFWAMAPIVEEVGLL